MSEKDEDDGYENEAVEDMVDNEEISPEQGAFMRGYNDSEYDEKEESKSDEEED